MLMPVPVYRGGAANAQAGGPHYQTCHYTIVYNLTSYPIRPFEERPMARILFYPVARQLWISISLLVLLINCGGAPESAAISTSAIPTLGSTETGPLPTVSAPVTTPTASSKNDSPALRWLKGTPSQAPCWEQLTPGSSTITDTTIRLSQLDSIANT